MRQLKPETRRAVVGAGLFLIGALFAAACAATDSDRPQAGDVTVFEGARLIAGDGGQPIEDAAFIVENGRFTEVGRGGEIDVPDGAPRVDLTGKTVMPAIIDAHKHFGTVRDTIVDQLQHMAYYGIGTTVSLGHDPGELPFQIREETIANAAEFLTAGRGITSPEPGRSEVPYWVTTEEEARTAVRELADRNIDLVKIWVDDRGGQYEKLSPELYGAIIDEAHQAGLRVTAHIFALEDAKGLLRAGVDAFAHGIRDREVDDEVVELFRERPNVVLVPNLNDRGVAVDLSWLSGTVPTDRLRELQADATDRPSAQERFELQARNLARLHEAGVPVALGTDGSTPWAAHLEMEDMVAAGMTPAEVIVAATGNAAELLQLEDVGTVATGKSADFMVLDANPLEDITNTRRIDAVYLRGTAVDRAALSARWTGGATQAAQ